MFNVLVFALASTAAAEVSPRASDASFQALIEEDWSRQEKRAGRELGAVESLQVVLRRADRFLYASLRAMPDSPDLSAERGTLDRLSREVDQSGNLTVAGRIQIYHEIRGLTRLMALKQRRGTQK